jgi:hypothetical protein
MSLDSWGSEKFKWIKGKTYYRQHDDRSHRALMIMLFKIDEIKGNFLIGKELLTNRPIRIHYKSYQAQEFEPLWKDRRYLIKHFFGDYLDGSAIRTWDPSEDTGWV